MANNLNETPAANRLHIAFFGRRNAGKSSVVNAVTGQNLSIVSMLKALQQILYPKQWSFCR